MNVKDVRGVGNTGKEYEYLTEEELQRMSVLKQLVSTYYGFQKVRVGVDNRLAGVIKEYVDFPSIAKKIKKSNDDKEIEEFQQRFNINVSMSSEREVINRMKKSTSLKNLAWLIEKYTGIREMANLVMIVQDTRQIERRIEKEVNSILHNYEIYNKWLKHVRGVGTMLSASLISTIITPVRFKNVSRLWQYAGLGHIYYCKECDKFVTVSKVGKGSNSGKTFGGMTAAIAHAEGHGLKYEDCIIAMAQKRVSGITSNWNLFLRMTCWKIGSQFVKQGKYYRARYNEFKAYESEKGEQPQLRPIKIAIGWVPYDEELRNKLMKRFSCPNCGYTADKPMTRCPECGQKSQAVITAKRAEMLRKMGYEEIEVVPTGQLIHNRAVRKTVKLFISHLWDCWMRIEEHEPTKPYASKILGHNYYPPPKPKPKDEVI